MANIAWIDASNQLIYNPRMPHEVTDELMLAIKKMENVTGHFLIATSGSTGKMKWTALAKQAILCSAAAVNRHLQSSEEDVWLNPLPLFHVAGLGIAARAFLSGAKVHHVFQNSKWEASSFLTQLSEKQATLTSLVPAQLFDLIELGQKSPSHLRAVIVGGAAVSPALYFRAVEQRWPLLLSYGMTECASQVATSTLDSWKQNQFPSLQPLDHVTIVGSETSYIKIRSQALLTGYLESGIFFDPKKDGWFETQDYGIMKDQKIVSIFRKDAFVKIGGERVDMTRLERIFDEERQRIIFSGDLIIFPKPDEKMGHLIYLIANTVTDEMQKLVERFNARVFPFERIRKVHVLPVIPRSPLNKLLKQELSQMLSMDDKR